MQVSLSELQKPCKACGHQNAGHTGGAKSWGWAIYDQTWANATGFCKQPGCNCPARK
jgi:hypothetical protein